MVGLVERTPRASRAVGHNAGVRHHEHQTPVLAHWIAHMDLEGGLFLLASKVKTRETQALYSFILP